MSSNELNLHVLLNILHQLLCESPTQPHALSTPSPGPPELGEGLEASAACPGEGLALVEGVGLASEAWNLLEMHGERLVKPCQNS